MTTQIETLSLEELLGMQKSKKTEYANFLYSFDASRSFSAVMRIIAGLVCVGAALYCFFVARERSVAWYYQLLATVIGACGGTCAMSVLFLVLKPIFWLVRKASMKKLANVDKAQGELCALNVAIIQNCRKSVKTTYTKDNYQARKILKKPDALCVEWSNIQNDILDKSIKLRVLQLERAKYGEWQWIFSALAILVTTAMIALALAVIYIFLTVLAVIILIGMVIAYFRSGRDDYYRPPKDTYVYEPDNPQKESKFGLFILGIYIGAWGQIIDINQEIRAHKKSIKQNITRSKEVLSALVVWDYPELNIMEEN